MEVKRIKKNEIDTFTSLSEKPNKFGKIVLNLWDNGLSYPKWCFIIEGRDQVLGRVGYWSPHRGNSTARIFGLSLPWESEQLFKTGENLLKESFEYLKDNEVKYIDSQLDSADGEKFVLSQNLYQYLDMQKIQSKKRFILKTKNITSADNKRLRFISLKETDVDFFIKVLKDVTKGTLDREDRLNVKKDDKLKAAEKHFYSLKSIEYSPENWFLAYDKQEIIGLIIPQVLSNTKGTINYIGVIPEQRGKGYVIDLLDKGIKNLIKRNIDIIIADIDVENYPMKKALLNMNFKEQKELINYRKKL